MIAYRHFYALHEAPLLCLTYVYMLLYVKLVYTIDLLVLCPHSCGYFYYPIYIPINILHIPMHRYRILRKSYNYMNSYIL